MRHVLPIAAACRRRARPLSDAAGCADLRPRPRPFRASGARRARFVLWLLLGGPWRLGRADVARAVGGGVDLGGADGRAHRRSTPIGSNSPIIADRVMAELNPTDPVVGQGGEVIIGRRLGGEFVVAAKVNNMPASFLFDTGASTVVIRAQDAKKIGVDTAALDYDVRVTTANGSAMAAETRLDQARRRADRRAQRSRADRHAPARSAKTCSA